jgi:hypothetical protein
MFFPNDHFQISFSENQSEKQTTFKPIKQSRTKKCLPGLKHHQVALQFLSASKMSKDKKSK